MNSRGYIIIALMLVLGVGSAVGLANSKWNTGYEQAIRVDVEPCPLLYWSIPGVEDKVWWDLESVQDRAEYLAREAGYAIGISEDGKQMGIPGDCQFYISTGFESTGNNCINLKHIACSADGTELYIGVDKQKETR